MDEYKNGDVRSIFAERLKALRTRANLSQGELAQCLGISKGAVSYYENAARVPDISVISSMAKCFNVTADYLCGLTDDPAPKAAAVDELGLSPEAVLSIRFWPGLSQMLNEFLTNANCSHLQPLFSAIQEMQKESFKKKRGEPIDLGNSPELLKFAAAYKSVVQLDSQFGLSTVLSGREAIYWFRLAMNDFQELVTQMVKNYTERESENDLARWYEEAPRSERIACALGKVYDAFFLEESARIEAARRRGEDVSTHINYPNNQNAVIAFAQHLKEESTSSLNSRRMDELIKAVQGGELDKQIQNGPVNSMLTPWPTEAV